MKTNITVLIPAYNEEENIMNILMDVFAQKTPNFNLIKVIVISDGSTDNTVQIIKAINNKKILLKVSRKRRGKITQLNNFFKSFKGDFLIQVDADTRIGDKYCFSKIAEGFKKGGDLICGHHYPTEPVGIVQRIGYFGVGVWEQAKKSAGLRAKSFWCTGQIRGFSKKYVSKLHYPKGIPSEDSYSFFFAASNNFKIIIRKDAWVLFTLPASIRDYIKQQKRFMGARSVVEKYFDKPLVKRYGYIRTDEKLLAFANQLSSDPLHALGYICLHSISKIQASFYKQKQIWDVSTTTKKSS